MEITILGAITIILSIYAFFRNKKLLLYMMVFLSTFTAANLIHIKITTTPVLAFEFTGAIWLLREFIDFIKSRPKISLKIIVDRFKENKLATAFLLFILVVILGEMYLAISGLSIQYTDIEGEIQVIRFCKANITRAFITIFIFVNMIVLSFTIKTREEIKTLLKVFCISSMFAVVWGLLQFITYYFGVPYPAFLFNNNMYAAQCYDQIDNNIKRISSIALEPSTFAINLSCFMPFVLGTYLTLTEKIREKRYIITFVILILTTACTILTTSTTTYIGLVSIYGLFGLYILFGFIKNGKLANRKRNFMKMLVVTLVSIMLAGSLCWVSVKVGYKLGTIEYIKVNPEDKKGDNDDDKDDLQYKSAFDNMMTTLKQMTIGKLLSGSGQLRMEGESIGISLLKYSPIIGLGLGSYRTFSLFTNILLNTGVIGIVAFFYILFVVLKELIRYRKKEEATSVMFIIAIIGTTIAFFAGVPDLEFTFYWMILVFGYKYATLE